MQDHPSYYYGVSDSGGRCIIIRLGRSHRLECLLRSPVSVSKSFQIAPDRAIGPRDDRQHARNAFPF